MTRLLPACPQVSTANLKAQGQTERPGGPRKTAVSQGARGEEGCSREDQHMKQKHDLAVFTVSAPAVANTAPASAGTAEVHAQPEENKSGRGAGLSLSSLLSDESSDTIRPANSAIHRDPTVIK